MMVSISTTLCWCLLLYYELGCYYFAEALNTTNTSQWITSTSINYLEVATDTTALANYSEDISTTTDYTTEATTEPITGTKDTTTTDTTEITTEPITDTTEITTEPGNTETTTEPVSGNTETTTEPVSNTTETTAEPITDICSSFEVNVEHTTPLNDSYLYIGSTATVRVAISLPLGFIQRLIVNVSQNGHNIDTTTESVHVTNDVKYIHFPSFYWNRYKQTGFQRQMKMAYNLHNVSASISHRSRRQVLCDFRIFLHNAKNLQDGQNVSIKIGITYKQSGLYTDCPLQPFKLAARTVLLEMNKMAYFKMDPADSMPITDINLITKLTFRAWVPHYNPLIKVLLKRYNGYLGLAYLRVSSIGDAFKTDFSDISLLTVTSCTDAEVLLLEFPSHWVNREYYTYPNTTERDVIVFEAGVFLTESAAGLYSNQSFGISILLNETEAWNTTTTLLVNSTGKQLSLQESPLVNVSIVDDTSHKSIFPSGNFSLILVLDTIPNKKGTLNINLWTQETKGRVDSAIMIGSVSFHGADESIVCQNLTTTYDKTKNSSINNLANIQLKYINSAKERTTNLLNLTFDVSIVRGNVNFANTYIVQVAIGNMTSKYTIDVKLPEILNDRNSTLLGQFHKLLDGENNTCIDLPVTGDFPPIFWTRFHTSWLGVDALPFEITLIGKDIPCNKNGSMVSKVSFPTSNSMNGFHGALNFCNVTYSGDMNRTISKCVYSCQCKNSVECSEVILFMTNHDDASVWNLCEMSAVRV